VVQQQLGGGFTTPEIFEATAQAYCDLGFLAAYTLNRFNFLGKRLLSIIMIVCPP